MRDHAGPQAPAPNCEQPEQGAIACDLHSRFDSLVTVRNPEQHRLQKQCNPPAVCKNLELLLEVTAKHQLFAKSSADGNANPEGNFQSSLWQEILDGSSPARPEPAIPRPLDQ